MAASSWVCPASTGDWLLSEAPFFTSFMAKVTSFLIDESVLKKVRPYL